MVERPPKGRVVSLATHLLAGAGLLLVCNAAYADATPWTVERLERQATDTIERLQRRADIQPGARIDGPSPRHETFTQADCERTRSAGSVSTNDNYDAQLDACFGISYPITQYRKRLIDICTKYPIDFNTPCRVRTHRHPTLPLVLAVERLDAEAVTLLLAAGATARLPGLVHYLPPASDYLSTGAGSYWMNPESFKRIMRELVQAGMDPNAPGIEPDPRGDQPSWQHGLTRDDSAVKFASRNGDVATLLLLLKGGADINATGSSSCTALDDANNPALTWKIHERRSAHVALLERYGGKRSNWCAVKKVAKDALIGTTGVIVNPLCKHFIPCKSY